MHELASLTCLIIFLYDAPSVPACRDQEHAEITQAAYEKTLDIFEFNGQLKGRYRYEQVCAAPPAG